MSLRDLSLRLSIPCGILALAATASTQDLAYRTEPAPFDAAALTEELASGALDALCFASPSAVRSFAAGIGSEGLRAARDTVVVAIGPVTQAALDEVGLPASAVAERPGPEASVEALAAAFTRRQEENA